MLSVPHRGGFGLPKNKWDRQTHRCVTVSYNLTSEVTYQHAWLSPLFPRPRLGRYGRRQTGCERQQSALSESSSSPGCFRSSVTCQVRIASHSHRSRQSSHLNPLTSNSFLPQHSVFTHPGTTSTSLNNLPISTNQ